MLEETADEAFKVYLTRKTQGWFRRWGTRPSSAAAPGAAAPAGAAAAAGAAGGGTPNRRIEAPVVSDDEEGAEIITPGHN